MLGRLKDKGLLDFGETVATYWPEFAQNGKEGITVADVVRHDSRLQTMPCSIDFEWTLAENIR